MNYGDLYLGKTTVLCKDTPAFIANRIGVFGMMAIMNVKEKLQLSIDDIDALTGPIIGRPKSATFRTADVVGNDKQSVTTAYAALVPTAGTYPRMQVYWHQAAPLTYWKLGSTLDAAWIKGRVPFFKEKDVQVTEAAGSASPYLRQTRFSVGEARCVAFEMRVTGNPVGSVIPEERESVSGIYCPPIGTPLTDALVAQATEGIYVLRDGKIERALRGIETPIPAHIQRAEKPAQG